jgi:hypothetical protein
MQVAGRCTIRIRDSAGLKHSVYNAAHGKIHHGHYYYFYRMGEWLEPETADAAEVERRLFTAGEETPVLIPTAAYRALEARVRSQGRQPPVAFDLEGVSLVLPGPYQACAADVRRSSPRVSGEHP